MMGKIHVVIGAGPAGLACADVLTRAGRKAVVVESDEGPGGLCQTLNFQGYLFDIGGHRFFSRSGEINALWQELMDGDLLHVRRLSRIYFKKRYFHYPLSFWNTLMNLGPLESLHCFFSYLFYYAVKPGNDQTFEGWVVNHFGRRLYEIFFKTYTEKVWAMACEDISADWALRRIRGLSLRVAIRQALAGRRAHGPRSLVEEFFYPRLGPGEFYHRLEQRVRSQGADCVYGQTVTRLRWRHDRIELIEARGKKGSRVQEFPAAQVFSSMPLPRLIQCLDPAPPAEILAASRALKFRSFLVVNVILNQEHVFPDQWLYIQDPGVRMGRIQNYKNWSPAMVSDLRKTSLGLEYFCGEGDALWTMDDVNLIDFAMTELERLGIASRRHLVNGFVVRRADAYPVYSRDYKAHSSCLKEYLSRFRNLTLMGRAGLFQYDNSDEALLSGIAAAGKC